MKPSAFRPTQQTEQREQVAAAEAQRVAQGIPAIEGSDAWRAWQRHCLEHHKIMPYVRSILVDGKERRGAYFPTLFPRADKESAA